jgi:hypothetical protein
MTLEINRRQDRANVNEGAVRGKQGTAGADDGSVGTRLDGARYDRATMRGAAWGAT